jgi:UDP-2,4-diacetamido-2,4,6-trideoxy-beta-L-altropyranose hydrolase
MGTGHVMRCLALAQTCQDFGGQALFAMAEPLPTLRDRLLSEGIEVVNVDPLPGSLEDAKCVAEITKLSGAEWIVVDGYHFDSNYQRELKAAGLHVLVVDDKAHLKEYVADIVLNQNAAAEKRLYPNCAPYTRLLLGSKYVLLRREFEAWRAWKRSFPDLGRRILITMGGSDPDNITSHAIDALALAGIIGLEVSIVVGGSNPHTELLEQKISETAMPIHLHRNAIDMPGLMAWADMALTAAGGTLWELMFMGCPTLSYARDDVQGGIVAQLGRDGVVLDLGNPENCEAASLSTALAELAQSPDLRRTMSRLGRERVDGKGASRVCETVHQSRSQESVTVSLSPVSAHDRDSFLEMGERHFRELDPDFIPAEDWKLKYFENILSKKCLSLCWVLARGCRVGFVLFGIEEHVVLPRRTGVIYELYVLPEFRRKGIARASALQAIQELQRHSPSKVQLEIMENNRGAAALWASVGFQKVAERWVLRKEL